MMEPIVVIIDLWMSLAAMSLYEEFEITIAVYLNFQNWWILGQDR